MLAKYSSKLFTFKNINKTKGKINTKNLNRQATMLQIHI